jgi:hypothetical protein
MKKGLIGLVAVGKHKNPYFGYQAELHLTAAAIVAQEKISASAMMFGDFKRLAEEIKQHEGKILLFTNFPPNSYYEDKKIVTSDDHYSRTKAFYKKILKTRPDIHLNIVTGAQVGALNDDNVKSLSKGSKIKIIRFDEWYYGDGVYPNYQRFVSQEIRNIYVKGA